MSDFTFHDKKTYLCQSVIFWDIGYGRLPSPTSIFLAKHTGIFKYHSDVFHMRSLSL